MASNVCKEQLNAQLQIMDQRLKQAEKNLSVLGKSVGALAKSTVTATGTIPNQLTAAMIVLYEQSGDVLGKLWDELVSTAESLDEIGLQSLEGAAIKASMTALGTADQYLNSFNQASQQLLATLDILIVELGAAGEDVDQAQAALDAAIAANAPQEEIDALTAVRDQKITEYNAIEAEMNKINQAIDSLAVSRTALENLAKCKTNSSLIS